MLRKKILLIVLCTTIAAALLFTSLTLAGCGKKKGVATEGTESIQTQAISISSTDTTTNTNMTKSQPATTPKTQPTSPSTDADISAVTAAATQSAKSNNPSIGELKVLSLKIVGSWARVELEPVNKSTDAASWFLKKVDGTWKVVDFGTSVMPSDHPDAPPEIFQ